MSGTRGPLARHLLTDVLQDTELVDAIEPVADAVVEAVLDFIDGFGGDESSLVDSAFGLADDDPLARGARLARVIGDLVPAELREELLSALGGASPPAAAPAAARAPAASPDKEALARIAQALKADESEAAQSAASFARWLMDMTDEVVTFAASRPPSSSSRTNYSPEVIARRIRDMILRWIAELDEMGLAGEHTRRAVAEIRAEMMGPLFERQFVAAVLAVPALVLMNWRDITAMVPGPGSNFRVGNDIHQKLQEEYRRSPYRSRHLIVQESRVYWASPRGQDLKWARSRDATLAVLYIARDRYLIKVRDLLRRSNVAGQEAERNLRDDNIDFTQGMIWEIKPIRGAALGVGQEFAYRSLFNFFVAWFKDATPPGGSLKFTCEHLIGGQLVAWPELRTNPARVINRREIVAGNGPQSVYVVSLDALPGIVMYLVVELPAAAVLILARHIERLLNEIARRAQRVWRTVATAVVLILTLVVVALLVVAVIAAVVSLGEALLAGVGALGLALAPILLRFGADLPRMLEALRRIVEQIAPLRQRYGMTIVGDGSADGCVHLRCTYTEEPPSEAVPRASGNVGPIRLVDAPVELFGSMEALVNISATLCAALAVQALEQLESARATEPSLTS
jgi:hypothetical protein